MFVFFIESENIIVFLVYQFVSPCKKCHRCFSQKTERISKHYFQSGSLLALILPSYPILQPERHNEIYFSKKAFPLANFGKRVLRCENLSLFSEVHFFFNSGLLHRYSLIVIYWLWTKQSWFEIGQNFTKLLIETCGFIFRFSLTIILKNLFFVNQFFLRLHSASFSW